MLIKIIVLIIDIALLIYFGVTCYRIHQTMKKADKLIEEMKKEIEGSGED